MQFSPYIAPFGIFRGTQDSFAESIYLLDEDYRILGMRLASYHEGATSVPRIHDDFFKHFPIAKEERGVLGRYRQAPTAMPLLIHAGNRPVLMLCGFFSRIKLLVAILPEGPVREALDVPGAYIDTFDWIYFSPNIQLCYSPLDEHVYACIADWLSTVRPAISPDNRGYLTASGIAKWLLHLTNLCGCYLSYDLKELEHRALSEINVACLTGTLFATLLTACSDTACPILHLGATYDAGADCLLFEIAWRRQKPDISPPFCQILEEEANLRGSFFATYVCPQNNADFCILFSPCTQKLSVQQIKALSGKANRQMLIVFRDDFDPDVPLP